MPSIIVGGTIGIPQIQTSSVSQLAQIMQVNFAYVADGGNPLLIHFTDQTSQNPTAWAWDFGDGSQSTSQNPSHTYATGNQSYYVILTATNALGTASTTVLVSVAPTAPSVISSAPALASFTATPLFGSAPLSVTFTDTTVNSPTSWSWTDNGVVFSTSQNPTQSFPAGTHVIVLTASNSFGWSTQATATIVSGTDPLAADNISAVEISALVRFGGQPLSVTLSSTLSTPGTYSWVTSDNQTSSVASPIFVFKQPGKYTITLTVTNNYGSSTASIMVYIPDVVFCGDDYYYVLDKPNDRVLIFNYSSVFQGQFGSPGSGLGQLLNPTRLTVNRKTF
jgi:PKD repeat protein